MRMLVLMSLLGCFSCRAFADDLLPEAMKPCLALRRDSERLACFDRVATALQTGKSAAAPSAENLFGSTGDMNAVADRQSTPTAVELRRITAKVSSLRRVADGMIQLELDNGQMWAQQESNVSLTFEPGDEITVSRGSLGTFRITDKRGRSARFKRVR